MNVVSTQPGKSYAVTATKACTVSAPDKEGKLVLVMKIESAGQQIVVAPAATLHVSDESSLVTQCFNAAPVGKSPSGGGDYVLPVAAIDKLGGVKAGKGLSVTEDGTASVNWDYLPANVFRTGQATSVSGKTTFTQSVSVGEATTSGGAVTHRQLSEFGEFAAVPSSGTWVRIPIEQAIQGGKRFLPADGSIVSVAAPGAGPCMHYGSKWMQSGVTTVDTTETNCLLRLAGRKNSFNFSAGPTKMECFLCCPIKLPKSNTTPALFQEGTIVFDHSVLIDNSQPNINGILTLIGVKPEGLSQFCTLGKVTLQTTDPWTEDQMALIYDALPHEYSYFVVSHSMGGPLTYYPRVFYVDAEQGKAVYLGQIGWYHYMHATDKMFFSLKLSAEGKVIFRIGRVNRFSKAVTNVSEFATELTDIGGEYLAFANVGVLSVANMFYSMKAL